MNLDLRVREYGDLDLAGEDITGTQCSSIDLRAETGGNPAVATEHRVIDPGTFTRALFKGRPGMYPVGEVRMTLHGREVSLVGARTNRTGVIELDLQTLQAASTDAVYFDQLRNWLAK